MGRLRPLSGTEVLRIFELFGFEEHSRKGSHVKLRRISQHGERETLVAPVHDDVDKGTLIAIFRQATRYIQAEDLRKHFYFED